MIEKEPGNAAAYAYRGFAFLAKGNTDKATADAVKVKELTSEKELVSMAERIMKLAEQGSCGCQ